jgi:nucleoside-diphosphate-sugar epimerase
MRRTRAVVCGGGGFIGGHLVSTLRGHGGYDVRSVDVKPLGEWHQRFSDVDNRVLDLRDRDACRKALCDTDIVYNLAADTGGRGFVAKNRAVSMLSAVVNTQLLEMARECGVERFLLRLVGIGRRRLSGHAGRRLELGEAVQRADVSSLQ